VPGTIWTASTSSGASLVLGRRPDTRGQGLEDAGFVLEARPSGDELTTSPTTSTHGVRIEIVDRAPFPIGPELWR